MVAATVTKRFFENSKIQREVENRGVKSCRERDMNKGKKKKKNESEFLNFVF